MNITVDFRNGRRVIGQGTNWQVNAFPQAFKDKLDSADLFGAITVPINDQTKSTYLANLMLHELGHVVLERNPLRQWGGWRDHTREGVMAGPPYGSNVSFDVASQSVLDYDDGTKAEMGAAFGHKWAWI
jgi:hypothetical protein